MPHPGSPGDKGPDGVSFLNSSMVSLDSPTYLSASGWDWMPAVRDRGSGIWDHVRLRSTGPALIGDPRVDTTLPNLPDTSLAEVTVIVPVRNASATMKAVTVSAAFDEIDVSITVTVPANGDAEVSFSPDAFPALRITDPRLWWPNGYGNPDLHDLVLTASVGGVESDRRTRRIGLRQLDYHYVLPIATTTGPATTAAPTPLQISVNGVRVFCRGGNWGWDELLRRMLPNRMDDVIGMHRDMHFTMIRNWIGTSTREELYSSCDENGILVWSEFWEGDGLFPPMRSSDVFLAQAGDTILRYRSHPCIAVWCGANESDPPAAIGAGLRRAVEEIAPGLLYLDDSSAGIITGDGGYSYADPPEYFTGQASRGNFGFHSEIGLPTVSVADSMRGLVGGAVEWPIGGVWYLHDWCTRGNQAPESYLDAINARLGESASLDEFCRKAQFINYDNMRAIFEAWNARLWKDASGVLLWMSNPAHHSTVWQTYDYDLDVNGSYYGARKGCESLHVQADADSWQVRALNHTPRALSQATVSASLYDLSGSTLPGGRSQRLDVAPSSMSTAFVVPFPSSLRALHLLRLQLRDRSGTLLSENDYWRYRTASDMRGFNSLPQVPVSVRLLSRGRKGQQDELTARIGNEGRSVAAMVVLSLRDLRSGERVLPTRYSDNYLWLLPGETRDVTLSWRHTDPTVLPELVVGGYNTAQMRAEELIGNGPPAQLSAARAV